MKRNVFLFAFVLALGVLVVPTVAQGVDKFRVKGPTVGADFYSSVDCVETSLTVAFNTYRAQTTPGPGIPRYNDAWVLISVFDACQDQQLANLWGYGRVGVDLPGAPESYIGKDLGSAALKTVIPAFDQVSGNTYDVSIDLAWTGVGPLERKNSHSHDTSPGRVVNEHSTVTTRVAECSGTVNYGTGNLTPETSLSAHIADIQYAILTIE